MPIEGLPDPARHRACIRCTKWFEPTEGLLTARQSVGFSGGIADAIRTSAGDTDLRFICHRCASVRKNRRLVLYAILGGFIAWAVAKEIGWIP